MDIEELPGYGDLVRESNGSRHGASFIMGNGNRVPNQGEVQVNMEAPAGNGVHNPVGNVFQVAEITRPLLSVSKICEQGLTCVFDKDGARVMDPNQRTVCKFDRVKNMYVGKWKLKAPFTRQAP